MIFTIACGNTHTTFGCVNDRYEVQQTFSLPTDPTETEFGYAAKIKQILDLYQIDITAFKGAILSCVVPTLSQPLAAAASYLTFQKCLTVGAGLKSGLHLCINDPGTVASDLVAISVAAKSFYPLPCVAIDAGTATTLSVIDGKGRYIGGAILPGLGIAVESLSTQTALLPHIELRAPQAAIGTNTVDCMRSGAIFGMAGSVDGLLDRITEELGTPPTSVIATGTYGELLARHCRHSVLQDSTLLLKGLRVIWEKNQPK